eukprot:3669026-Prymnesium_polylepis.2
MRKLRLAGRLRRALVEPEELVQIDEPIAVEVGLAVRALQVGLRVRVARVSADKQHQAAEIGKLEDTVVVRVESREAQHQLLERLIFKPVEDVVRDRRARAVEHQVKVPPLLLAAVCEDAPSERAREPRTHRLSRKGGVCDDARRVLLEEEPVARLQCSQPFHLVAGPSTTATRTASGARRRLRRRAAASCAAAPTA